MKMRKKILKRVTSAVLIAAMMAGTPKAVFADSAKIVTLGADLTQEQRDKMFQYFGVSKDEVEVIEVNNQEERKYLEGIATEQQIGKHTYSCAYIMPTDNNEINVKTANLTWVSTSTIANTLVTAGVSSCDVIAAAPIEVSGTGALTGIIKAYETATDDTLDEEKKELAMKELMETSELGDTIGDDQAAAVINDIKDQVIKDKVVDQDKINDIIKNVEDKYEVEIPKEDAQNVAELMTKIGGQDYDYDAIKGTINNLQDKVTDSLDKIKDSVGEKKKGFLEAIGDFFMNIFKAIGNFFANLFGGSNSQDASDESDKNSILNNTDDSLFNTEAPKVPEDDKNNLGADEKTDSIDTSGQKEPTKAPEESIQPQATELQSSEPPAEKDGQGTGEDNLLGADEKTDSFQTE